MRPGRLICLLMWMMLSASSHLFAAVTVTAATGGTCLNISPGAYTTLGNIVINEGANGDFTSPQTNTTFILSAPAGFEFQNATGSVSYQAGRNITAASIAVTTTTITVTISVSNTNKTDLLTISGINVRSLATGNTGNIYRTGGTATITGDAVADNINHGSLTSNGTGFLVTTVANGNWSSGSTWSTGTVPSCGEDIMISHAVTADMAVTVPNLTIGTGGNLTTTSAVTISSTFTISGTGIYTHNNTGNATTTIFAGTESFSTTSTIVVNQWYNFNVPLANPVTGDFGNITFNASGTWQQNGKFAPAKIKGDITISAGTVVMDNGTGATTSLTLNNVNITGSGNITVASGSNRDLTLNTGNFTDNGNDGTTSYIVDGSTGTIDWNVTGDVILNDDFSIIDGAGTSNVTIDVTGDLDITGGDINLINSTSATFHYNITGTTTISGTPTRVTFVNSGSGTITLNTGALVVTGGTSNEILSGSFSGSNSINTTGNLEVTGASASLYLVNITGYTPSLNLNVGNDLLVTNGDLVIANSSGTVDATIGRHMTVTGSTSLVYGQYRGSNTADCDFNISGTFTVSTSATFYHSVAEGNINMTIGETLAISNGYYFGINHTTGPADPTATYNFQDFDFAGGTASFFDVKTSANTTVNITCTNNFTATWLSSSDWIELVSYDGNNDASLNLNIGGDFTVTGNYDDAYFLSSQAGGTETVNITGSMSVSGGTVMFVCDNTSTSGVDAHSITTTVSGDMNISGGKTFLSTRDGSATINLAGDLNITGGILNLKWLSGSAIFTISGDYYHTAGTFNLHSHTTSISDTCKVYVYGNFTQTGGTLNFDNAASSSNAEHKLYINGGAVTLGGSGVWTHANNGTNNPIFGQVYYNSGTTTTYNRSSSTHEIQHVRQTILGGTTVDASSSSNGFRITSNQSSNANTHTSLYIYGILDMGSGQITSRQTANYYSRMMVYDGGRLRLSHTGGLYSGSATASTFDGMIVGNNRANFYLYPSSIVEYYGTATMFVTGIPNGIATTNNHKYGILEINHTGTAGSAWVYPETDDEVFIRTELRLTEGEFNLDTDHITTNGGNTVNVEAGGTITRTNGFIRSETEDGSADLRWYITANGSYTIPFGYDASEYIPFTYQQTSGSTGELLAATYRTASDNTPYPPTVNHVNDVYGVNNSAYTVDRFWKIEVSGAANSGLTFTYTNSEGSTIVSPRAQLWEPVSSGWFPPSASQSNPTSNSTAAGGITVFNSWWTLSAASSPLPIQLISFEAKIKGTNVSTEWVTGTELNNDYFTVERSTDGVTFEAIGNVDGAGTTSSPKQYQYTDTKPVTGTSYYRLKQTDFDGRYTYSQVRSITFAGKNNGLSLYPNPATSGSSITLAIPDAGTYKITVISASGQIAGMYQEETSEKGTLSIPAPGAKGIYLIYAESGDQVYRQKLIISE